MCAKGKAARLFMNMHDLYFCFCNTFHFWFLSEDPLVLILGVIIAILLIWIVIIVIVMLKVRCVSQFLPYKS